MEAEFAASPLAQDCAANQWLESFPETALDGSIMDRFETIATRYPHHQAVSDDTISLSYADVSRLAGRIAGAIAAATRDRPGQVAILLRNEARYSVAMLGVLASGRAFVPLNAEHPTERNRLIVAHAGVVAIVSAGDLAADMRTVLPDHIALLDLEALGDCQELPRAARARPGDLAYIPYTSGSTGRPKGVRRHHRSLLHYAWQTTSAMLLRPADRMVSFNSPSLTEGLIIAFCALLNGASLHCLSPVDTAPAALTAKLRARGITVIWSVPRLFRHLVEALPPGQRFDTLRLVSLAGDRVDWGDIDMVRRGCTEGVRVRVGFGSTEAGVHAQWFVDEALRGTGIRLPVGRAPADQRLMLLDDNGDPVADGKAGEVVVAGRSVALGYWQDPEATALAFAADPDDLAARIYRTGDLALRRPDGLIEYVGRKDQQIKLGGQRIEISEVESALTSCHGVRDAAVVVRRNESGVPRSLAAYCEVASATGGLSPRDLGVLLAGLLPQFMVPASITILPNLPRLANFKIDREELRRRDQMMREEKSATPPQTATEVLLADLWAEVFEAAEISRDDDFFALGGDSLAAATIGTGVQDALGSEIDLSLFADNPTLAELAAAIDATVSASADDTPLIRASRDEPLPLSYIQEMVWNCSQTLEQAAAFSDTTAYRLVGALDIRALREAIDFVIGRHESLRTTFDVVDGRPAQIVHPAVPISMPFVDLADVPDPEQEARLLVQNARNRLFDLKDHPLLRFSLIRLRDDEHWLVQTTNHAICDASSRLVFTKELGLLYDASIRGEPPPLPECEQLQYGDYAAWQRRKLSPTDSRYQNEVGWWQDLFSPPQDIPELPFAREVPVAGLDPADGLIRWGMTSRTGQRTVELAREERTTPYVVRLAAFAALLAAVTGDPTVFIGTHVDNRNRRALQGMIGSFVNVVALKLECAPKASFRDWIGIVGELVSQAMAHSEIPYQTLLQELTARGVSPPIFRIVFHSFVLARMALSGLEVSMVDRGYTQMPAGFTVTFREHDEDRDCSVAFDAGRYDPALVQRFVDRFIRLLDTAVDCPHQSVESLVADVLKEEPKA
jgi:amino acid adenylation domain-containing protein